MDGWAPPAPSFSISFLDDRTCRLIDPRLIFRSTYCLKRSCDFAYMTHSPVDEETRQMVLFFT